ncbi:MAG: hypothetical protein K6E94_07510 [Elusimicrobiaceae bacterium]|nr:hypothetical protein [Elusimicrobiaceae bacterium]
MNNDENIFNGKVIVLGLTGALTCFKICPLIMRLKKEGARFRIIASENALNFITKTTLQTLAKTAVLTTQFNPKKFDEKHKSLAEEGDVFLLAPATAQTISKTANGIADNLLTSVLCAWQKPLIVAPAMNPGMWFNPATQTNIAALKKRGAIIVDSAKGALPDIEKIYQALKNILTIRQNLTNKKILITSGNTKEIFGGNLYFSQLKENNFGKILADMAYQHGAKVTLITTALFDVPYEQILVKNTEEMARAVSKNIAETACFFMAANLAPYKPQNFDTDNCALTLVKNEDFFPQLCLQKKKGQIFVLISENTAQKYQNCDYLFENISAQNTQQELATKIIDTIGIKN